MAKIIYFGTEGNGKSGHRPIGIDETLPTKNMIYDLNVTIKHGFVMYTKIQVGT